MSGRGTTDAIFIVRQLQEKHLAFVDLEKAFDRVPRDVIWWAMRKLGIDDWLVRLVQSMYKDVRSRVRVGSGYSEDPQTCSGIKGPLRLDPDFRCARCLGQARPINGRLVKEVQVEDENVEAVPEFCYLGDMLSAGGGCELAAVTRCKSSWGVPTATSPPHQLQPATFDQRSSVFNLCESCNAACDRNMGYECGYT